MFVISEFLELLVVLNCCHFKVVRKIYKVLNIIYLNKMASQRYIQLRENDFHSWVCVMFNAGKQSTPILYQ